MSKLRKPRPFRVNGNLIAWLRFCDIHGWRVEMANFPFSLSLTKAIIVWLHEAILYMEQENVK